MKNSLPLLGDRPNWYRGLTPRREIDYFGSTASRAPGLVHVTRDGRFIVTRDEAAGFSVMHNVCAHAGAEMLSEGRHEPEAQIRCPIHKWRYDTSGKLIAAPHFCKYDDIRLERPTFGSWRGFLLGYTPEDLRALDGFGASLGLPDDLFSADAFVFGREVVYDLPYPREVMTINYLDCLHVQLEHERTFEIVADSATFRWELGPTDTACSYSIQLVRLRDDVAARADRMARRLGCQRSDLAMADLVLWLDEAMPDRVTPIDRNIFSIMPLIYPYLTMELYLGGLFLAVGAPVSRRRGPGGPVGLFPLEYHVHKSVPEALRPVALQKFIRAFEAVQNEDDAICLRLAAGHDRDDLRAPRHHHEGLEAGDPHFRAWFLSRYAVGLP